MFDLAEFVDVTPAGRASRTHITDGILIEYEPEFALTVHQTTEREGNALRTRSLTLEPPYGNPIYVPDVELDKWLSDQRDKHPDSTAHAAVLPKTTYKRNRRLR